MAVHAAQVHCLQALVPKRREIRLHALVRGTVDHNIKLLRHPVAADQILHALAHVVDHRSPAGREAAVIPPVGKQAPERSRRQLGKKRQHERHGIHRAPRQQQDNQVHNKISQKQGKPLAVDHLGNTGKRDQKGVIGPAEQTEKRKKQEDDQPVAAPVKRRAEHPPRVEIHPDGREQQRHRDHVQNLYNTKNKIMLWLLHQNSPAKSSGIKGIL